MNLRSQIIFLVLSLAPVCGAFAQSTPSASGGVQLNVVQTIRQTEITLKESDRGALFAFCDQYLNSGKNELTSAANDLSISCRIRPRTTFITIGIGYSQNVVAVQPSSKVVLLESLSSLVGLSAVKPNRLFEQSPFMQVLVQIDDAKIRVEYTGFHLN